MYEYLIQFGALFFRHEIQSIFIDHPGALVFLLVFFELCECNEHGLFHVFFPIELDGPLKDGPGRLDEAVTFFKLGVTDPVLDFRVDVDESLVDGSGSVNLLVSKKKCSVNQGPPSSQKVPFWLVFFLLLPEFELDVGEPSLFLRLPLHPSLENRPTSGNVLQHLFHVGVFVPKLVDPGQDGHGAIPQVAGVIDLIRNK